MSNFISKRTTDYSSFKYLKENRTIRTSDSKYKNLKKSIQDRGYLISPVVVSEEMFVIDGQHRIQVCKDLRLPVDYVVNSKIISKNDVVAANNTQRAWSLDDYIENLAAKGDDACRRLRELILEYSDYGSATVADVFCGHPTKKATSLIKGGLYSINEALGHEVLNNCLELKEVREVGNKYKQTKIVRAIKTVMKRNPEFSIDEFKDKLGREKFRVFNNESEIVEEIVRTYNFNRKKGKII